MLGSNFAAWIILVDLADKSKKDLVLEKELLIRATKYFDTFRIVQKKLKISDFDLCHMTQTGKDVLILSRLNDWGEGFRDKIVGYDENSDIENKGLPDNFSSEQIENVDVDMGGNENEEFGEVPAKNNATNEQEQSYFDSLKNNQKKVSDNIDEKEIEPAPESNSDKIGDAIDNVIDTPVNKKEPVENETSGWQNGVVM